MISIAWYNLVAIIVGVVLIAWLIGINSMDDSLKNTISGFIYFVLWLFVTVAFYAIWGGIFWW